MELLDKLRIIADDKLKINNNEKYRLIKEMLSDDNCFFLISSKTALSLLFDLGFSYEESISMYEELISPESYKELSSNILVK